MIKKALTIIALTLYTSVFAQNVEMVSNNFASGMGVMQRYLIEYDGKLIFSADDGIKGIELWAYDGTSTTMVSDIYPFANGSDPSHFKVINNVLYFHAKGGQDPSGGLYKYDGTNVSLVKDGLGVTSDFVEMGNYFYFCAGGLWKSDGVTTTSISNTYDVAGGGNNKNSLHVYLNELYFTARYWNGTSTPEMMKYDGVGSAATQVGFTTFVHAKNFITYNNKLCFPLSQLYEFDGTNEVVISPEINPSDLFLFNNAIYYSNDDGVNGRELWKYDGTTAAMQADINNGFGSSLNASNHFTEYNNELYFIADDDVNGLELWKYDGVNASLINDIKPGAKGSTIRYLTVHDNDLYFSASNQSDGANSELWKHNGTTTEMVEEINTNTTPYGWAEPSFLTVYDNNLYFTADDGTGHEIWRLTASASILNEDNLDKEAFIYPNPNNGKFSISLPLTGNNNYTIKVTDVLGKDIYQNNNLHNASVIEVTVGEAKGLYTVMIIDNNGNVKTMKALVK